MSYTPTEWNCGDTITADKMNKIEQGIADCCGGGTDDIVVVRFTTTDGTSVVADKTYAELVDAVNENKVVKGVLFMDIANAHAEIELNTITAIVNGKIAFAFETSMQMRDMGTSIDLMQTAVGYEENRLEIMPNITFSVAKAT